MIYQDKTQGKIFIDLSSQHDGPADLLWYKDWTKWALSWPMGFGIMGLSMELVHDLKAHYEEALLGLHINWLSLHFFLSIGNICYLNPQTQLYIVTHKLVLGTL